ncbi:MAG: glycosyltransferase family 39 protein [Peptococcaceae bacterium]|nr:glycosyltransferase family 39 protein [Peptococcaceae bacterium]
MREQTRFRQFRYGILPVLRKHTGIIVILCISLVSHILALWSLGATYTLDSDDAAYIISGIRFLETGEVTMHDVISAQILPGMTWLIALFALFLGTGTGLWLGLKLLWLVMGVATVLGVYKIVRLFAPSLFACLAAAFLLAPDFIWMDNLILTETPFMFCFVWLFYYSFRLAEEGRLRYFVILLFCFFTGFLMKPVLGIFPVFLIMYLLWKKYDIKRMGKQFVCAVLLMLVFLVPWTVRNYQIFDAFIPLTYGTGNPLLLGTYQGRGYPPDEELDLQGMVYNTLPEDIRINLGLDPENPADLESQNSYPGHLRKYNELEVDGMVAKYRMREWWNRDPVSMLESYFVRKPIIMLVHSFYWEPLAGIPRELTFALRGIDLVLAALGFAGILLNRRHRKEAVFVLVNYLFHVGLYSYTFAFSRYAQTLFFMRFILLGWGLYELSCYLASRNKRPPSETEAV